jgi:hypothetical protein
MGTIATFTHEKQLWIAVPAVKNQAIHALVDKLVGIHAAIAVNMVRWINQRPQDADLVSQVLERTAVARQLTNELIIEKGKVFTS